MRKKRGVKRRRQLSSSQTLARFIAESAADTKAQDIVVLDLRRLTSLADYFVICSGTSDRQVQAIAETIADRLKEYKKHPIGREGERVRHWVVIDFGDVVAHVFHQTERAFYQLEKLWGDAPRVRLK